ncbi:trans-sialidase, putative, partial [Trypanosoma cruzi]
ASSLLYKSGDNNELIALYEKKNGDDDTASQVIVSVRLTAQLKRVKDVLSTWKEVEERVSQMCTNLLAQNDPSPESACGADKITDGLVGFLSGSFSDNTWRDEYLGVNATVKNGATEAREPSDGVTFHGAWAEWPVGEQGENQLYHFANYNFTLVATVSIDGEPTEGNIPLLGVKRMKGDSENTVLLGLSYNKEKKWMLQCGDGTKSEGLSSTGEPETKRHVVILLRHGNQSSAYVDGQPVGAQCALGSTETQEISHFYIGGDGGSAANKEKREDVFLTVTNVLLYNRPLNENEISVLNPNKVAIQHLKDKSSEPSPVSSDSVNPNASPVTAVAQQTETLSTPDGKHLTEQRQSMGSSNAGSGGASTTAVSAVSTPAAGEESVMQVAPGSSSDGDKKCGWGFFF